MSVWRVGSLAKASCVYIGFPILPGSLVRLEHGLQQVLGRFRASMVRRNHLWLHKPEDPPSPQVMKRAVEVQCGHDSPTPIFVFHTNPRFHF